MGLHRASGRKGRRGGSWYRIQRLHHSCRRAGGSRGTGTAGSVQNSASAAASVAAAVATAVVVAVVVASATAARTFAGTGRDQLIDRWDLGLQACRLARRIPALYSRNQSRTNIALLKEKIEGGGSACRVAQYDSGRGTGSMRLGRLPYHQAHCFPVPS